jgi:16S rRNA (guanine527-N7)-methyltransferase
MESSRIAHLLQPFVGAALDPDLLQQLDVYFELLVRWNARVNLTAIRDPEQIVTRHFGESLFAAQALMESVGQDSFTIADVGSGAGFPGVPMKLRSPQLRLTLIESQNKKATFLRELIRMLALREAEVFYGRAEQWGKVADVVTMRAVEQFERMLQVAAGLVSPDGKLCLLIGAGQFDPARQLVGEGWLWRDPVAIPQSDDRVVAIAERAS